MILDSLELNIYVNQVTRHGYSMPMIASPGTHLRVRRPCGYWRHGIYIADNRVIQFGGWIREKRRATVDVVSFNNFAQPTKVWP